MIEELKLSFRFADEQMTEKLKKLWKTCFGDSDEYIELFFRERFKADECMVALCGDKPAGMLFLLPITAICSDECYPARYIYAVCTDPLFRNRSVSTKLLGAAHEYMAKNGIAMSLLVPAESSLFDYYAKRGFETEFYCKEFEIPAKSIAAELSEASLPELFNERNTAFYDSSLYMRWDKEALCYQQKEVEFFGGKTLRSSDFYAVCFPYENKVLIKEWGGIKTDPDIIAAIAARFGKESAVIRVPASRDEKDARPFAMTRWYISERSAKKGKPPCFTLVLD